jgi:hypothetical protein
MIWKSAFRNIGLLFVLIFITGCSKPNTTATSAPVSTQAVVSTDTPAIAATEAPTTSSNASAQGGQCANQYYPVRQGATWSYTSTGSPAGTYSFTDTITAVRSDGFTLTSQFKDLTRIQEWACKPEGLVALQLGGGALSTQNLKLQIDTQNASGVTYPPTINAGDQWDYALDFTGKMDVAGNSGSATGNDKAHFKALGVESVTVPAGTFDAMKVQIDTTLDINVSIQGLSVPVAFTSSYNYWYAQNVGWVKASGTGSVSGQSFSENIELQSYNVP